MNVARFTTVARHLLSYLGDGLMWLGLGMAPHCDASAAVIEMTRSRHRAHIDDSAAVPRPEMN